MRVWAFNYRPTSRAASSAFVYLNLKIQCYIVKASFSEIELQLSQSLFFENFLQTFSKREDQKKLTIPFSKPKKVVQGKVLEERSQNSYRRLGKTSKEMEFFRMREYNKSLQPNFQMDIESSNQNNHWNTLMTPITAQLTTILNGLNPILVTPFSLTDKAQPNCLLTLTSKAVLVSETNGGSKTPSAGIELCFDLKFEVLYQTQTDIRSPKTGIRLYTEEGKQCSFFAEGKVVEMWAAHLAKKLHQKGFHERFKPLRKLGKGNFATVYQVERMEDKKKFAVKAFSKQACFSSSKGKDSLSNELNLMRELGSDPQKNLLQLEGVFESDNSIYVVIDLLEGGQLFQRIQERNGYFTEAEVKQCMLGLVSGLHRMHKDRIMHRDLKPQNIMLRTQFSLEPVIVDFGLATYADQEKYLFYRCGTPGYVAPEIIGLAEDGHVEPECDLFSVGVIFHILLTRKPLFQGSKYQQVYKHNKEMQFNLGADKYKNIDPMAMDLMKRLLEADPKQRITANSALEHPYFQASEVDQKVASPCLTAVSCNVKKI